MPAVPATHGDLAATDGLVRSHAVRGAHTAMADDARARELLESAATIDVARAQIDGEWLEPDALAASPRVRGRVAFDVVIRNTGTGHHFPGGTRDLQDTWVELRLFDATGRVVAEAGTEHEDGDDPSAFVLRSTMLDHEGHPERLHRVRRFRAAVYDRTLAPRDATVARYEATLPREVEGPLRIEALLRHRRHGRDFSRFACDAHRSDRGRRFQRTARSLDHEPLDPCRPEPVLTIARSGETPRWRRLHDLALGLTHNVQERLDEARPVLELARAAARTDHERAAIELLGARVAARQGRVEEAVRLADRAEELAPDERAAIARVRGEAYAQVWRWEEAAREYAVVAERAPLDTGSWRDLARARGSAGDDRGALDAARVGLELNPRDAWLLRSQHLALEAMGAGTPEARAAFLSHRDVDEGPRLLRVCQREIDGCDRDRQPVPTIEMRTR